MSPLKSEGAADASLHGSIGATSPNESLSSTKTTSRKRRASTIGSRGIANLTAEQLAKKRANDREAQRAIRERTKQQIENLERRIRELQCQQPYQELQHVIRQKEAVEAENAEIKSRLTAILNIVQPILAGRESEVITPPHQEDHNIPARKSSLGADLVRYHSQPTSTASPTYADTPMQQSISPVASIPSQATWHNPLTPSQPSPSASNYMADSITNRQRALASNMSAEKLTYSFFPPGHPNALHNPQQERYRDPRPPLPADSHITLGPLHNVNQTLHHNSMDPVLTLPHNILSTCPLDGLLLDFIAERRLRRGEALPESDVIGPLYPSFICLFRPDRGPYSHTLSRFLTDILSTFPDISMPPEQIAILYIMFILMRWSIYPCRETYDRLPDWVKPSRTQIYNPHPIWIDYLPWPALRDYLCLNFQRFPFDNFFIPFTTTVSLNWPYAEMSTLQAKPGEEDYMLNPVFEEHLRDLRNWSLGPAFAKAHPSLADTVRIKE